MNKLVLLAALILLMLAAVCQFYYTWVFFVKWYVFQILAVPFLLAGGLAFVYALMTKRHKVVA